MNTERVRICELNVSDKFITLGIEFIVVQKSNTEIIASRITSPRSYAKFGAKSQQYVMRYVPLRRKKPETVGELAKQKKEYTNISGHIKAIEKYS